MEKKTENPYIRMKTGISGERYSAIPNQVTNNIPAADAKRLIASGQAEKSDLAEFTEWNRQHNVPENTNTTETASVKPAENAAAKTGKADDKEPLKKKARPPRTRQRKVRI